MDDYFILTPLKLIEFPDDASFVVTEVDSTAGPIGEVMSIC